MKNDFLIETEKEYNNDKDRIINTGIFADFLKRRKNVLNGYLNGSISSEEPLTDYNYFKDLMSSSDFNLCLKIDNNLKCRRWRYGRRLIEWLFIKTYMPLFKDRQINIIFGTLTFSPKALTDLDVRTRARYVATYCRNNFLEYMANVDYGEKNNREHYHFLAFSIKKPEEISKWAYGFDKLENVRTTPEQVKNYILKLSNHAFKASSKMPKVITPKPRNKQIKAWLDMQKLAGNFDNWLKICDYDLIEYLYGRDKGIVATI